MREPHLHLQRRYRINSFDCFCMIRTIRQTRQISQKEQVQFMPDTKPAQETPRQSFLHHASNSPNREWGQGPCTPNANEWAPVAPPNVRVLFLYLCLCLSLRLSPSLFVSVNTDPDIRPVLHMSPQLYPHVACFSRDAFV